MACGFILASITVVAVVGLERTFYQVSEDVGVVELCAVVYEPNNIDCPITFPFDVHLSTSDNSAGKRDIPTIVCTRAYHGMLHTYIGLHSYFRQYSYILPL